MKNSYYKIPLEFVPFNEIPSLEKIDIKFAYCSYLSLAETMNMELNLVSVYNVFSDNESVDNLKRTELLFGEIVAEKPLSRGKAKFKLLDSFDEEKNEDSFPQMKYSNLDHTHIDDSSGNWFYIDKGKYFIIRGIRSEYEKVRHLEGISMHTDAVVRLKIIIELLKKNVKNSLIDLTVNDYYQIAFKILKADPVLKAKDETLESIVNTWMPMMLSVPLYEDIPVALRGRVAP